MQKIPQYVSDVIDESINRALRKSIVLFNKEMDVRFEKFGVKIRADMDAGFLDLRADMDVKFLESYLRFKEDIGLQIGGALNEFDSRLKTIGEYIDTKTTPHEVRQIIHEKR